MTETKKINKKRSSKLQEESEKKPKKSIVSALSTDENNILCEKELSPSLSKLFESLNNDDGNECTTKIKKRPARSIPWEASQAKMEPVAKPTDGVNHLSDKFRCRKVNRDILKDRSALMYHLRDILPSLESRHCLYHYDFVYEFKQVMYCAQCIHQKALELNALDEIIKNSEKSII